MPNQCYTIVRWVNSIRVETCLFLIKWRVCRVILLAIPFNLWPQWSSFTRLLGSLYSSGVRRWFAALQLLTDIALCWHIVYLYCVCVRECHWWADASIWGRATFQTKLFVLVRTKYISLDVDYPWFFHPRSLIETHYQKWPEFIAAVHNDTTKTIEGPV